MNTIDDYLNFLHREISLAFKNYEIIKYCFINESQIDGINQNLLENRHFWGVIKISCLSTCILSLHRIIDEDNNYLNKLNKILFDTKKFNPNELKTILDIIKKNQNIWKSQNFKNLRDKIIAHYDENNGIYDLNLTQKNIETLIHDIYFIFWAIFEKIHNNRVISYEDFNLNNFLKNSTSMEDELNKLLN